MQLVIIIIGVLVISFISKQMSTKRREASIRKQIMEEFGQKHFRSSELEDVRMLMEAMGDDTDVDAITWNDLDMDAIYRAINNCNSYVGEQYLYKTMPPISKGLVSQ